jgi:hypothetical protein
MSQADEQVQALDVLEKTFASNQGQGLLMLMSELISNESVFDFGDWLNRPKILTVRPNLDPSKEINSSRNLTR